jgi:hypothetical protein
MSDPALQIEHVRRFKSIFAIILARMGWKLPLIPQNVIASEAKQSIHRAPLYEWIASSLRSSQ